MKIPLKLSSKQLGVLVHSFNALPHLPNKERDIKVARSILDKVAIKLKKSMLKLITIKPYFLRKRKSILASSFTKRIT